uniref:Leucine-rich repeat containing protein n=1 Tax=Rhizophora mucronata TaxID=61149 RepID=A0A2P2NL77_RHIMU
MIITQLKSCHDFSLVHRHQFLPSKRFPFMYAFFEVHETSNCCYYQRNSITLFHNFLSNCFKGWWWPIALFERLVNKQ